VRLCYTTEWIRIYDLNKIIFSIYLLKYILINTLHVPFIKDDLDIFQIRVLNVMI